MQCLQTGYQEKELDSRSLAHILQPSTVCCWSCVLNTRPLMDTGRAVTTSRLDRIPNDYLSSESSKKQAAELVFVDQCLLVGHTDQAQIKSHSQETLRLFDISIPQTFLSSGGRIHPDLDGWIITSFLDQDSYLDRLDGTGSMIWDRTAGQGRGGRTGRTRQTCLSAFTPSKQARQQARQINQCLKTSFSLSLINPQKSILIS